MPSISLLYKLKREDAVLWINITTLNSELSAVWVRALTGLESNTHDGFLHQGVGNGNRRIRPL